MEEKVSVILVNYNGKEYNDKCIRSILDSTIKSNIHVVVVDNASTDDSLTILRECWGMSQQVTILALDKNYGFSKANNEGIKWAIDHGYQRFLLLNNDTEIKPDAIEEMLEIQISAGGIVVPKILYADKPDVIWCAGGEFSEVIKKPLQRGLDRNDDGQYDTSHGCGFANGCCLMLSKEIIDKIGFLDERFFLYYEDTEYSLRAQQNHIPIWYCAKAVIYHKVNGSTKGNEKPANAYYITRNWLLCNRLHMKARFYLFCIYFFFNRAAWIMIWLVKKRRDMVNGVFQGVRDFKAGKWGKYDIG